MGQLWSRAVGGHEDNNQSPIAVAIRDNNSQEVHHYCFGLLSFQSQFAFYLPLVYLLCHLQLQVGRLLKEGVIEEQGEPLLCLAARFKISCSQIALF